MDEITRRFLSEKPKTKARGIAQEEVRKYLLDFKPEIGAPGWTPALTEVAIRARLRPDDYAQEVFGYVATTARLEIKRVQVVFRGGVRGVAVDFGTFFRDVFTCGFAVETVIPFHTHPSGNAEPSPADYTVHDTLRDICLLFGLRCEDHLILTEAGCFSLAEGGMVPD
ncbi:MAG: JAB domain-containing protein [Desulfobacterales bacterium]|nr:JAB domain-containing protein [Desulfobacterales bacterium]